LRSTTPAWQFITEPQRDYLTKANGGAEPPARKATGRERYAAFATGEQSEMFTRALRLSMTVAPYGKSTLELCNRMNSIEEIGASPVLPCCSTEAAFGDLHGMFHDACEEAPCEPDNVQHPTDARYWLPYSVCEVDNELREVVARDALRAKVQRFQKDQAVIRQRY
jgi:hypothetical protein